MSLAHLLYVSRATSPLGSEELGRIHESAIDRNRQRRVTGLLLYSAGNFVQLLEGDVFVVVELLERIRRDPRHTDVELVLLEPVAKRLFGRWHMGLLNLEHASPLDRNRLGVVLNACRERRGQGFRAATGHAARALLQDFRNQLPAETGRDALALTTHH